jgi:hypothetical protein
MKRDTPMSKILLYDLETSYIITREKKWGLYDENPLNREIIEDMQILCFAYKWLGEDKVKVISQDDFPSYVPGVNNDFMVVAALYQLFSEADIVIAHNGDQFDQRKTNARLAIRGFDPPSNYFQVDTKKVAKRYFGFTSNKLSDLAIALGLDHKADAGGLSTWDGCLAGDPKAWKHMKEYNKQDVKVLEQIYLKLRPWIVNHPNIGLIDNEDPDLCENCGSDKLIRRGTRYTSRRRYQRLRCECGHWQKGKLIKD